MPTKRKILFASLVFGLFVYLILPAEVVAVNDDFGYLRSVIATLQHGRPWTDDWLGPWAASFSSLAAGLFLLTGHFHFATYGLLGVLGAASFAATALLLTERGFRLPAAFGLAALFLTFPTFFWKEIEFTAVALYLPCLLFALWTAERKRWGWFSLVWLLALSSRQSALAWAVIPGLALVQACFVRKPAGSSGWLAPALAMAVGGLAFIGLNRGMNATHAQILLIQPAFTHIVPANVLLTTSLGLVIFFIAAGLGAFVLQGRAPFSRWRHPVAIGAITVGALLLLRVDPHTWLSFEHEGFNGAAGLWYFRMLVVVAAVGWAQAGVTLRLMPSLWALACIGPVCLRPQIWDYYLLEVGVLGFFAVALSPLALVSTALPTPVWWRRTGWLAPALLGLGLHLSFVLSLKVMLDRARLFNEAAELALRAGTLHPDELNFLPFGSLGWRLYPHYIHHEGKTSPDIAGFVGYIRPGSIDVGMGFSKPLHLFRQFRHVPPADHSRLILSREAGFCWFFTASCYLLRGQPGHVGEPSLVLDEKTAPHEFFPLNDEEWRALIAGQHPL